MKNSGLILALETSGRSGSVGVRADGGFTAEESFTGSMRHCAELLPAVGRLLKQAGAEPGDIRQVVITSGPGSFTGLRIAVTAAKMFYLALKTPIVALDSLDVIAENAQEYMQHSGGKVSRIAVVLDAKKDCFYAAAYQRTASGLRKHFGTEMMTAPELLDRLGQKDDISILGEGLVYHKDRFAAPSIDLLPPQWWQPRAHNMFRLARLKSEAGDFADPVALTPTYIRPPDAIIKSSE